MRIHSQSPSVSLHAVGAALGHGRILSSGKLCSDISMPDNWLLYQNRFNYQRWKFPAAGCTSGTTACSSRSPLSVHNYWAFKGHCSVAWSVQRCAHKVLISAALGLPCSCRHSGRAVSSSLQVYHLQNLRLLNFWVACSVVEGSLGLTVQCSYEE